LLPQTKMALTEPGRSFYRNAWDQDQWAATLYARLPIQPALALLRATRQHIVQLVGLYPDAWERSVVIGHGEGEGRRRHTIGEIIGGMAEHTYEHLDEIHRTRRVHGR
jgi:hypothetical protein